MNCHSKNSNNGNEQGQNHRKHIWMMVLCCALPVVAIAILAMFKINNPALKSLLTGSAVLLCPLMHLLMLPMMFKRDKKSQ